MIFPGIIIDNTVGLVYIPSDIGGWAHECMTQRAIDGPYIYFVTTNTAYRLWVFDNPQKALWLGRIIQHACTERQFVLLGYCILPDHLHLLVYKQGKYSLSQLMKTIKGRFWRVVSGGAGQRIWQPRFNFRIIQDDQRLMRTVDYVRYNFRKTDLPNEYATRPYVYLDWVGLHRFWG